MFCFLVLDHDLSKHNFKPYITTYEQDCSLLRTSHHITLASSPHSSSSAKGPPIDGERLDYVFFVKINLTFSFVLWWTPQMQKCSIDLSKIIRHGCQSNDSTPKTYSTCYGCFSMKLDIISKNHGFVHTYVYYANMQGRLHFIE